MKTMMHHARPIVGLLVCMTVLLGGVYPVVVTLAAKALFPVKAQGSLIEAKGQVIGSELIGQPFASPRYFQGRPSATTPFPYNAMASVGSNMSPGNPKLREQVSARVQSITDATAKTPIPLDLVTSSASGLDPHISAAGARYQIARVAKARGMQEQDVAALVARHTEQPLLGILGEPRVNVLKMNLVLDGALKE